MTILQSGLFSLLIEIKPEQIKISSIYIYYSETIISILKAVIENVKVTNGETFDRKIACTTTWRFQDSHAVHSYLGHGVRARHSLSRNVKPEINK